MDRIKFNELGINLTLWNALRDCQKNSIDSAMRYLQSPLTNEESGASLLSLPTGAGKSGVISTIAHFAVQSHVLILCHRRPVCNQLFKDVKGGFFKKTAPDAEITQRAVFRTIKDVSKTGIYVTTFQMLARLDQESLAVMKATFDLILIDEGHTEPSPVWRTLVRETIAHKIVITATPYRNDLFQFNIDPAASYIYTLSEALDAKILVEPQFETIAEAELLTKVSDFLKSRPYEKCIVKCKDFKSVEKFYTLFSPQFLTLALHDQYKHDVNDGKNSTVPKDLASSNHQVIIHQHKLDEGVDIPSAKLLVLTYVLGSGRELVQTIGRVVRVFNDSSPTVLEFDYARNLVMWKSYQEFDYSLRLPGGTSKFLASLDSAKLIELYLDAFPAYSYHENRFVGKFDINHFDPEASLVIPTASICFLKTERDFSVEQAADTLYWRNTNFGELSRVFHLKSLPIFVIISIAFNRSRFLANQLFFEPSFELTLLRQLEDGTVAIFDSRGRAFSFDKELAIGGPIPQERLLKVMTQGASMRPKEASTRAISRALRRPEAMHIKGQNLDELRGQQQFSAYRMATIKCDTLDKLGEKSGSYYVGVEYLIK